MEQDPAVPLEAVNLLLTPLIGQTLHQGGRVVLVPPPGIDLSDLWEPYQDSIAKEPFVQ